MYNLPKTSLDSVTGAIKTAKIYLNSGLAMLADIQIPRSLLTPFHRISSKGFANLPSLEHTPFGRRTGGRGKKRNELLKARKAQNWGGAVLFSILFLNPKCVARLGVSPGWRGPRGAQGGFLHPGCGRMEGTAPMVVS